MERVMAGSPRVTPESRSKSSSASRLTPGVVSLASTSNVDLSSLAHSAASPTAHGLAASAIARA